MYKSSGYYTLVVSCMILVNCVHIRRVKGNIYYHKYENICLFLCQFVYLFLVDFEPDWYTLWHKIAYCSWEESKATTFGQTKINLGVIPPFCISLRFFFNFDWQLLEKY